MSRIIVLIDNGHGIDSAGKHSPDYSLMEWEYTREIAAYVIAELRDLGIDAHYLVQETWDVALSERARRVNMMCDKYGDDNVLLVSIHVDAAGGDGKWHEAGGWSCFTTKGKTKSDQVAELFYDSAEVHLAEYKEYFAELKRKGVYGVKQRPIRTDTSDGDRDREENFTILYKTKCPAVLTENLFQDNKADVAYLLSDKGKKSIIDLHVAAIRRYLNV